MYEPSREILERYAEVLIGFALNDGQGIEAGDVVMLQVPESAKPLLVPLQQAVLKRGGHPIIRYIPDGVTRAFFESATDEQISYKPEQYMLGRVADVDHMVSFIAQADKHELEGIDPAKMMLSSKSVKFYRDALDQKENKGEFSWTAALYGTQAMAQEVGMSLEEYRKQIIDACMLDQPDPIAHRQATVANIHKARNQLSAMPIQWLHIKGEDVDLKIQLGKDRKRLGGTGRNIPSFEVFISPDWRGTEGWIRFNQPLYRYGNLITGIELRFVGGKVVESRASQNEHVLQEMIATKNADRVGEFSLTDTRFSRITRFMGETLYDENVGGPYGNTHIALGAAYKDSYPGDPSLLTESEREALGYNDSVVHTDIVSTTDRTVVATMADGSEQVIYQDGKFTFLE